MSQIEGGVKFHIGAGVTDMADWSPKRVANFFNGIAQVVAARGADIPDPESETRISPHLAQDALELPGASRTSSESLPAQRALNAPQPTLSEAPVPARKTTLCAGIDQRGRYHGLKFDPIEDIGAVDLPGNKWICGECVDNLIQGSRPKEVDVRPNLGRPTTKEKSRVRGAVNGNTGKARRFKKPAWSGR